MDTENSLQNSSHLSFTLTWPFMVFFSSSSGVHHYRRLKKTKMSQLNAKLIVRGVLQ